MLAHSLVAFLIRWVVMTLVRHHWCRWWWWGYVVVLSLGRGGDGGSGGDGATWRQRRLDAHCWVMDDTCHVVIGDVSGHVHRW